MVRVAWSPSQEALSSHEQRPLSQVGPDMTIYVATGSNPNKQHKTADIVIGNVLKFHILPHSATSFCLVPCNILAFNSAQQRVLTFNMLLAVHIELHSSMDASCFLNHNIHRYEFLYVYSLMLLFAATKKETLKSILIELVSDEAHSVRVLRKDYQ